MTDTAHIFRSIRDKEEPAEILYEDEKCLAFRDKFPKAPTHILFIPKQEIASIADLDEKTKGIPEMLILKAKKFAEENDISGYKLLFNVGREGGQEIDYLHLHLLAEKKI